MQDVSNEEGSREQKTAKKQTTNQVNALTVVNHTYRKCGELPKKKEGPTIRTPRTTRAEFSYGETARATAAKRTRTAREQEI